MCNNSLCRIFIIEQEHNKIFCKVMQNQSFLYGFSYEIYKRLCFVYETY